jgi:thioredoxin 1
MDPSQPIKGKKMHHLKLLSAALVALYLSVSLGRPAFAATEAPFTQEAFVAAERSGKPILVHISAWWCPVCFKQRPILESLSRDPAFCDLVIFKADFDTQKDVVRQMGAQQQSTLVVFHGDHKRGRSVGETDAEKIRALLLSANN